MIDPRPLHSITEVLKPGIKTLLVMMAARLDRPMNLDDWRNMASMLDAQAANIREAIEEQ